MSETAKHTPGPWRITYESGPFELAVDSRIGLVVNPGGLAGETIQEYEANARILNGEYPNP